MHSRRAAPLSTPSKSHTVPVVAFPVSYKTPLPSTAVATIKAQKFTEYWKWN